MSISDESRQQQHGSLRALARVMGCSPPYICRLRNGVTKNPGPAVLRKLGLRRVVTYELIRKEQP